MTIHEYPYSERLRGLANNSWIDRFERPRMIEIANGGDEALCRIEFEKNQRTIDHRIGMWRQSQ